MITWHPTRRPKFATVAAAFDAAERRERVHGVALVDPSVAVRMRAAIAGVILVALTAIDVVDFSPSCTRF
jgi:hypothetical protein